MEEKRERALALSHASIEKSDTRDDQEDNEGAEDEVGVVEFVAQVLGVDINLEGVSTLGFKFIVGRLYK